MTITVWTPNPLGTMVKSYDRGPSRFGYVSEASLR